MRSVRRRARSWPTRCAPWGWTSPGRGASTEDWPCSRRRPRSPGARAGSTTSCAPHSTGPRCSTSTLVGSRRSRSSRSASGTPRPAGSAGPMARSCVAMPPTSCTSSAGGRNPRRSAGSAWSGSRRASPGSAPRSTWVSCSWSRAPTTRRRTWWGKRCSSWTPCRRASGRRSCSVPPSASRCGTESSRTR